MNKATFTRLIQDSSRISDTDMLALEQVVQAFPYCHAAHMLLAKAANDRGSMLAPQRLRRAAIHAPSRAILKKLVESAPMAETAMRVHTPTVAAAGAPPTVLPHHVADAPAYQEELEDLLDNDLPHNELSYTTAQAEPAQAVAPATPPADEEASTPSPAFWPAEMAGAELEELPAAVPEALETEVAEPEAETPAATAAEYQAATAAGSVTDRAEAAAPETPIAEPEAEVRAAGAAVEEALTTPLELASGPAQTLEHSQEPTEPAEAGKAQEEGQTENETEQEKQPLSTFTEARQEEQLADVEVAAAEQETAPEAERPAPGVEESEPAEAPAAVSEQLPEEEPQPTETPVAEIPSAYSESLIKAIFRDSELGYSMASSRMGESLEPKGELTRDIPFHFQPELLVEYSHIHAADRPEPEAPQEQPLPQQDLINEFLKKASKLKGRAQLTPKAEEQEDLSNKSTKLNKSLVSENLAQIFAMQGKTKKAIKIYQQLQLKMPEKRDYFAAQIVKLQNISS